MTKETDKHQQVTVQDSEPGKRTIEVRTPIVVASLGPLEFRFNWLERRRLRVMYELETK